MLVPTLLTLEPISMKKQAHHSSVKIKPVLILPAFVFLAFISSHQVAVSKRAQAPYKIGSPLLIAENYAKASFLADAAEHRSQRIKKDDFLVSAPQVTSSTAEPAKKSAFRQQLPVSTPIAAAPDFTIIQKDTIPRKNLAGEVFTLVEQPPLFPGGLAKLYEFLGATMEYPAAAKSAGLEGLVITQFIITKEGKITEVKLIKKLSAEIDAEAKRVIALMLDWRPGQKDGQPVNVRYTLPIRFSLQAAAVPQAPLNPVAAPSAADSVFALEKVQQNPEYPGGLKEMYRFLAQNVRYPKEDPTAVRPNAFAQGAVIVQFIVTKKGEVKDINVVKSLSPRADAEVKRVISTMPKWTPGQLNGETVNVRYTLPVRFNSQR